MVKKGQMMKIGLMLYPSCLPTGLLAALDFFRTANLELGKNRFEVKLVSLSSSMVTCGHGQKFLPEATIEKWNPDAILLPGFWADTKESTIKTLEDNQRLQSFLNSWPNQKYLWSYCTGVLFHAQTGRLNGKRATATWWLAQDLMSRYPKVKWQIHQNCISHPQDLTSAGANGFYGVFEEVLKSQTSPKTLSTVQKYLMSPSLLDQNDPFYELDLLPPSSSWLQKVIGLVEKTRASELSLSVVANELAVSTKTLSRHLQNEISWTPAHFFRLLKLKQAAEILIHTNKSISEICDQLGFEDESNFSRSFKASVKLTPADYRQRFQRRFK